MSSSDREEPEAKDALLAERKARYEIYEAARDAPARTPARDPAEESIHDRSKFAIILNELDVRSRKSSQWLTALSIVYVAVVLVIVAALYSKYSGLEKMIDLLEKDLAETKVAIADQASFHQEQSEAISARITATGEVLDGMGEERKSLEAQLDEGKEKADELLQESDALKKKIAKIDGLLEGLSRRAQPFYAHYAIDPTKRQAFGKGKRLNVLFDNAQSKPLPLPPDETETSGKFRIPASGTYMVTGWFSTEEQAESTGQMHIVETEIQVNGIPYWRGFSYGNGVFTSAVALRAGQTVSIHATFQGSEESGPPSGFIEKGEIRIARLYYSPE